jgi:hypothetical protein
MGVDCVLCCYFGSIIRLVRSYLSYLGYLAHFSKGFHEKQSLLMVLLYLLELYLWLSS